MKKTVAFILVFAVICSGLYIAYKRDFDQFNPLYKEQYVYAAITKPGKIEGKEERIRYRYNLTGATAQGEKKKITFSSSKELEQNTYVRVLSKGAYTREWILIKKEDIPNQVLK
ncbi:YxeA family protein [Paenibacillus sp. An7]|uniref:YxeA family protein n=1 Tax=Paenibacillus sp. An7 TaxID=2689577 RepID=UPI00135CDED2|nr:YxeA family protein [Paenibacillus sp. An7]